jgi:uncharacterized protein
MGVADTVRCQRADFGAGAPPALASCLYEGTLGHRRHAAPRDALSHRMRLLYIDLDELPGLFDGRLLWSARRPAIAWFRRADYLGERSTPLAAAVRELVRERTQIELDGPIRLLTHLRQLGHCFNPVSFYYCFDAAGERVRAVVAEVTNTPWRERHSYVMPVARDRPGGVMRGEFAKAMHVSPLMGMDQTYDWRLTEPGERLSVQIRSTRQAGDEPVFDATLALRRRELTPRALRRALALDPAPTMRLTAHIYWHALSLRLRGARWHAHPATDTSAA